MFVELGNADALEGYRDPTSDTPDEVRYHPMVGEKITTLNFPDGTGLQEAFSSTITTLVFHLAAGAAPQWIASDSAGLKSLLEEHFGLSPAKNIRPATWGNS